MSATAESVETIRLADPRPDVCSACLCSSSTIPDQRFVDFMQAFDGGEIHGGDAMAVMHRIGWLYLCETCVQAAAEALAFKPNRQRAQLQEIKRLVLQRNHWRDQAQSDGKTIELLRERVRELEGGGL